MFRGIDGHVLLAIRPNTESATKYIHLRTHNARLMTY